MPHEHEQHEETGPPNSGERTSVGSLESAKNHLERCAITSDSGDGGRQEFAPSFSALLDWGIKNQLIFPDESFPFLRRPPDGFGQEHEAWFDESRNRWFKATYANRFGLAWGRDGSATALEYLARLVLQNVYFGDDIQLEALVNCSQKLRVLTSQPHIAGEPASFTKIHDWFTALGFTRVMINQRVAWFRAHENLLIADAHEGNVIKSASGIVIPIDLNIVLPGKELRNGIVQLIREQSPH